ncbi:MAG: O-antigen ligase family protein [Gaiellaceae bacterium]
MAEAPRLLPGLLAVGVFLAWAALDGGYPPTVWYPGALFLLALLGVVHMTVRGLLRGVPRATVAALGLLGAFTAWTFLTIAWAGVEGDAWDGANRTFLYLTVYALFALWPWRPGGAAAVLGTFSLGVAAIAGAAFLRAVASDDPADFFTGGRWSAPVGYVNADAALLLLAFWPAVFLASRRETPLAVRGPALAAAGLLLELAVLPQSRGALFAFPVVLLLYVAFVPGRVRSVLALAPVLATAFLARGPLLDLYESVGTDAAGSALREARGALVVSVVVLLLVGTALALADRFVVLGEASTRRVSLALGAVGGAVALALAGVALAQNGSPVPRVERAWDDFKTNRPLEAGSSRFSGGVGSNRYDFWRVAAGEFTENPIRGAGADNFAVAYLRERRSDEEPLYPHSLELQVLSQTGLVGAVLFGGFLVSALVAAAPARFGADPFRRAVTAAALVAFAYWFVHASVDWFWEFPGLTAPALAWLGLSAGLGRTPPPAAGARRSGSALRLSALVAAVGVGLLAVLSYALPWLAAREVDRAAAVWRSDPEAAYDALGNARRLNPLSDRPDLVAGAIASRVGDVERMRAAFRRGLERNPNNWYAHLQLAVAASLAGERERALALLEQARELNPAEPVLDLVAEGIREGEPVSPEALDRMFLQRVEDRAT